MVSKLSRRVLSLEGKGEIIWTQMLDQSSLPEAIGVSFLIYTKPFEHTESNANENTGLCSTVYPQKGVGHRETKYLELELSTLPTDLKEGKKIWGLEIKLKKNFFTGTKGFDELLYVCECITHSGRGHTPVPVRTEIPVLGTLLLLTLYTSSSVFFIINW